MARKKKLNLGPWAAEAVAAKLAKTLQVEIDHTSRCYTQNGVHPDRIKNSRDERLVALMCPLDGCKETFPLKKRGDRGSANFAAYEIHLRTEHGIFLPKPADVMGW
jgi:hypothetical protein